MKTQASILFLVAVAAANASVLFDFEDQTATSSFSFRSGLLTSLTMEKEGVNVTIVRDSATNFDVLDITSFTAQGRFFPSAWGDRALDPFIGSSRNDYFVANFSVGLTSAQLDMVDFGADSDIVVLEAWSGANGTGTMLGGDTFDWGEDTSPNFATVSWTGGTGEVAQSLVFRGGSVDFGNSMFVDNIAVTPVPEPATLSAVLVGLAAVLKRRRK